MSRQCVSTSNPQASRTRCTSWRALPLRAGRGYSMALSGCESLVNLVCTHRLATHSVLPPPVLESVLPHVPWRFERP